MIAALIILGGVAGTVYLFVEMVRWHDRAMESQREVWNLRDVNAELRKQVEAAELKAHGLFDHNFELAADLDIACACLSPFMDLPSLDDHFESAIREHTAAACDRIAPVVPMQRQAGGLS